jgi:hypothetical protein
VVAWENARRCEQGRGAAHNLFTYSRILRYEDTVIGFREDKLIERRRSRNLLDSDLKPNPNWPLTEQVSSEVHAIEVRELNSARSKGSPFVIRKG